MNLTATKAVAHRNAKEISPLELVDASIERIVAVDSKIYALPIHCFQKVRAAAKSFDMKYHSQNSLSLCGIHSCNGL